MCDQSNESYWAVPSCGTAYCAVQGGSYFSISDTVSERVWYRGDRKSSELSEHWKA